MTAPVDISYIAAPHPPVRHNTGEFKPQAELFLDEVEAASRALKKETDEYRRVTAAWDEKREQLDAARRALGLHDEDDVADEIMGEMLEIEDQMAELAEAGDINAFAARSGQLGRPLSIWCSRRKIGPDGGRGSARYTGARKGFKGTTTIYLTWTRSFWRWRLGSRTREFIVCACHSDATPLHAL